VNVTLASIVDAYPSLAVAVSGGVDSMTLASFVHRVSGEVRAIHAVSPAVPRDATERVRRHAAQNGWTLEVVDSGEFADERYRSNPANRCYFCKVHLYDRIRELTDGAVASGANLDDLGDYRPGLMAAAERNVLHPFVLARMGKADVRALARDLGLSDLSDLPAQPCLASRIETGIEVSADDLGFVERVESMVRGYLPADSDVRCRITARGVELELSPEAWPPHTDLTEIVRFACRASGRHFAGVQSYLRGRMFLR
jgi:pyridinium-3,5-biscarboxylic acid mononucleotide sulfurtransferase